MSATCSRYPQIRSADERGAGATPLPKSHLVRILTPRIEEILETVAREPPHGCGLRCAPRTAHRPDGEARPQLAGLQEQAARILEGQVRIGRPLGIKASAGSRKRPGLCGGDGASGLPADRARGIFRHARRRVLRRNGNRRLPLAGWGAGCGRVSEVKRGRVYRIGASTLPSNRGGGGGGARRSASGHA